MSDPLWVEQTVTEISWDELPCEWLLDGSTGMGQGVGIDIGEGVVYTDLAMGPTPGWAELLVTDITWEEMLVTEISWTELSVDA
jgi:hypothetical protein